MLQIREYMEYATMGIEILAVVIMVLFIIIGTIRWIVHSAKDVKGAYERFRVVLGKTLLIGLELLVAADIIRTVAFDTTLISIGLLGCLVVVRTFLGWSIIVEIEGCWPWQKAREAVSDTVEAATKEATP